jgi:hypothetical protein
MKLAKIDKGVAGLNLFLSLVVFLFIIGLVVMIFALLSGGLRDATYTPTTVTVQGEDVDAAEFNSTGYTLLGTTGATRNANGWSIVALYNNTDEILL